MATSTTNLGLIKPAGTDKIRIAQINSNMDVIDAKMGAVGNTPLQTQITTLNTTADAIESGAAIRAIGNTHAAITAGQFVYVRNHSTLSEGMYTANGAIAANATLSTSNLTALSGGGLNSIKAGLDTLNSKIDTYIFNKTYSATTSITGAVSVETADKPHRFVGALLTSGGPGFVFRRDESYFTAFNNSMQPLANTAVTFIAYFAQYVS